MKSNGWIFIISQFGDTSELKFLNFLLFVLIFLKKVWRSVLLPRLFNPAAWNNHNNKNFFEGLLVFIRYFLSNNGWHWKQLIQVIRDLRFLKMYVSCACLLKERVLYLITYQVPLVWYILWRTLIPNLHCTHFWVPYIDL